MNKILQRLCLACACVCACACSSNDLGEDEPNISLSTIVGRWNVTAYKDGAYYIPATNPEYYEFEPDGNFTHIYEYADDLKNTTTGHYTYDRDNRTIHVEEPRGWNLDIAVQFTLSTDGNYNAIFNVTGRTSIQSKTVKVQRQ